MNYYPFHIGDYASATRHLSWDEDTAFRRLLDVYYTTEKPIPNDLRQCCRLVMATTETQREAVEIVLKEFFVLTDEGWINTRADREISIMREKQQKQRDKANRRWHKPKSEHGNTNTQCAALPQHSDIDATAYATASENDANAMPPTPTPTPKNIKRIALAPPDGVSEKTWQDFQRLRRQKRAPLTETALDGIRIEATRAGYSLEQALATCCLRGWQGFDADWVAGKQTSTDGLMAGVL